MLCETSGQSTLGDQLMAKGLEWITVPPEKQTLILPIASTSPPLPICPELLMSGKIDCSHLPRSKTSPLVEVLMSPGTASAGDSGGEVRVLNNPLTVAEYSRTSYQRRATTLSPASPAGSEVSRFCFLY